MEKVIRCEQGLRYAGTYTFTEISFDASEGYELFNDETETGYIVDAVTYATNTATSPDVSIVNSYKIVGGANVSGQLFVPIKVPVNFAVINAAYASGGNVLPFYMPFFSLKVATNRYLYCGLKVETHSTATTFGKTFGVWWSSEADANTAATVDLIQSFSSGGSNFDYAVCPVILRSAYFAVAMPTGVVDPPADEYVLRLCTFSENPGTLQAGQKMEINWSSNSSRTVSMGTKRAFSFARWYFYYGSYPALSDPEPVTGPTSGAGGYGGGSFSGASDTIALPNNPGMGVTSAGFIRVYNIGIGGLSSLGFELFPPLAYTAPTALPATSDSAEALVNGFNAIVTFLANIPSFFDQIMANTLINYVIDCHVIPVSPGAGSSEAIHVGPKTLTTYADRIYTDYVDVSCGSINIAEFYDNFADMLSTAKLYLPFVGFVPVRPEWFQGNSLAVDYKFNVIDGSFSCFVRSGGKYVNNASGLTIVGQYAGTACMHIPITGVSYASMVSGLVGAGSGMVVGAGSGNIAAAATSAIEAATARGDMASSNAYSSSAAFLGCRVPFLMIERPVSSYSANYAHEYGFPANVYAKLGDVPGFVRMEAVHVDGISGATESEKAEIKRLLAQGVIV